MNRSKVRLRLGLAAAVTGSVILTGCSTAGADTEPTGPVELTFLTGTNETNAAAAQSLADAFNASQDDVVVVLDRSVPDDGGDNYIKTLLATGEMEDMFFFNSGAQLAGLNPEDNLLDVAGDAWIEGVNDAFVLTVSSGDSVYGPPIGTATGGGIFYWIPDYEELGLEVPTTWDEFIANSEALKAAGKEPIIQSFGDPWTSQVFLLADFYNVLTEDPEWATAYTANQRSFAETSALAGFEYLEELHDRGLFNSDFASLTYADAMLRIGQGQGTHYPMLTWAVDAIAQSYPENLDNVGFFALPGDGPEAGLTVWMPPSVYAPKDTAHPDEVKQFMAFVASTAGCDALTSVVIPTGPYLVDGCTIPDDVPRAVQDMLPYFQEDGLTAPALEFLSPVKGPALPQITVEVGSGIRSAIDGAKLYDEDVKKQAQQLGLPGW